MLSIDKSHGGPAPANRGGIYPGVRGAYAIVGPHTPMWSITDGGNCMLPDCKMIFRAAFLRTRSWDRILWGTPEQAEKALRDGGVNYFLSSRGQPIVDVLPLSPLFSAGNIGRHFGIRWTDGTTTLLTWAGPAPLRSMTRGSRTIGER